MRSGGAWSRPAVVGDHPGMIGPQHPLLGVSGGPWVLRENEEVDLLYPLGSLVCEVGESSPSCSVIFVAKLEDKNLVCIPGGAWHRAVAKRVLPPKSFSRPVAVEVIACDVEDRSETLEDEYIKVWLGFLSPEVAELVQELDRSEPADYDFPEGRLPHGNGLVELARDHFAFFSPAENGGEGDHHGEVQGDGSQDLTSRVGALENVLGDIQEKLMELVSNLEKPARPSALKSPRGASPKPKAATTPAASSKTSVLYPDLDPGVVAAAQQAGVSKENLEQIQRLVGSNVKGAKTLRQQTKVSFDPLSEEEEEEIENNLQGEGSGLVPASSNPMEVALSKLTDIVDHLSDSRRTSKSKLEAALDGVAHGGSESSFASSGKRSAAARRALRSTLLEAPEEIYGLIEKLMAEDVSSQSAVPGSSGPAFSARSWMEHRSRIGSFRATAHCGWGVAGILDSLMLGKIPLARAKAALLLLQIDQSCIDKGSWLLAGELSLEMPPPMSALATHNLPSLAEGEWPYSRLLDSRWSEIAVAHLRDQDDYLSKRKNLGKSRGQATEDEEPAGGGLGRKAKAKAKQKALAEDAH